MKQQNGNRYYPAKRTLILPVLVWTFLLLWPAVEARGEEPVSTLRGTVLDPEGSAIPGASVTVTNLGTGISRTGSSDGEGNFEFQLEPGAYEIDVSREGYASRGQQQVELGAGGLGTLQLVLGPDPEAKAGGSGSRPAAPSSEASGLISESQLVALPLNGRSYGQLATLRSEVSDPFGGSASRGGGSGGLTVAGGRSTSNIFLLDGTNVMDAENQIPRSAAGVQLGSDAVFQVRILSTNYGAEFGRGSGGVLNSITRSGTPQFHGTFFEFFRNSKMDARNFFDPGPEPTPFKRNQFGFTLTGPVRKDQTFFLVSFEALRDRLTETSVDFFPDDLSRTGIITDAAGNVTDTVAVHPGVQPYLALFPVPNSGRVGRGIGENRAPQFLPTDENFLTVRVDHGFSERDSLFARYTFDDAASHSRLTSFLFRRRDNSRQQYVTLVETHVFSPRALNTFRFGFTRPGGTAVSLSAIEIPSELFFVPGSPQFGIIELAGANNLGPLPGTPLSKMMESLQFADDLLIQRAAHALKLGFEIHRYHWDTSNNFQKGSLWSFNSLESFLRGGSDGTTNLSVALPGSDNRKILRQTMIGFYVQDDYKIASSLQLNLGLRYEVATLMKERDDRVSALLNPASDSEPRIGSLLKNNPSLRNFAPRLGFSWAPGNSRKTVLSGGFGIYYDQFLEYFAEEQKNSAPFYKLAIRTNFDSSTTFPDAVAAAKGVPFLVRTFDYERTQDPMVLRYTFSIQRELAEGWQVRGSYTGARGNHLFRSYELNLFPEPVIREDGSLFFPPNSGPINPVFGSIGYIASDVQSFYNSLQFSSNLRLGGRISLQASYNYSKSVDEASDHSFKNAQPTQYGRLRTLDRGLSDFDIRHRLVINSIYELPWGAGRRWWNAGYLSRVFGNWRVGSILSFRTGTPYSPEMRVQTRGFLFAPLRPSLLPGQNNNPISGRTAGCSGVAPGQELGTPNLYFDPCVYAVPEPGTLGTAGRNTIVGPGIFNMDLSLQRDFIFGSSKKKRLQFRAEFFNLPNHPSFSTRGVTPFVFTGSSGRLNPTAAKIRKTSTTARQIQFALRFSF